MQDLTGKIVWITGAGTGIGESGALKLAGAGCQIVLSGRRYNILTIGFQSWQVILVVDSKNYV